MRCWFAESVARRSLAQLAPRYMSSRHLPKWMAPGSFIRNLLDASNVELGTSAQPENPAATTCIAHKSLRICERCRLAIQLRRCRTKPGPSPSDHPGMPRLPRVMDAMDSF